MNGSWLNILDPLGVNTAGVLICTSVSACWGILNLFFILLPIRKRAEIELWEIDVIGLIHLDRYLSFLPWLLVLWTPQIEFHPLHAQYQFWLPTGFFGSRHRAYCWLLGPLQCISLLFHLKLSCFGLDFRLIELCLFGSCPSVEQLEIFCFPVEFFCCLDISVSSAAAALGYLLDC